MTAPRFALLLGAVAALLIAASFPLSALAHQLTVRRARTGAADDPVRRRRHARREPAAAEPDRLDPARDRPTATLGADAASTPSARTASTITRPSALAARRLPHPGLGVDARAPAAATVLPRRQVLAVWRWTSGLYVALMAVLVVQLTITDSAPSPTAWSRSTHPASSSSSARERRRAASLVRRRRAPLPRDLVSWVVGQVVLYRRSSGDPRQQLKWLLAGRHVCVFGFFSRSRHGQHGSPASARFGFLGLVALPISIGIGILRYRLYDIDRLITRTLSYALLTGLLVGVFVGLVLLTTGVLPFRRRSASPRRHSPRLRCSIRAAPLQRLVDRRFNRARYDAEATVAAFGSRLRDAVDPETVLSELAVAAGGSLQPAHVSVWSEAP